LFSETVPSGTSALSQLEAEPIFVVGVARSGTTWVLDLIGAHPLVAQVMESWMFTSNWGVGALFKRLDEGKEGLTSLVSREELISEVRALTSTWLARALEPTHRFLVEKSPDHLDVMELIAEIFPGSKFIHVIRDGRDVAVSQAAAVRSWAPDWENVFGSVHKSAVQWNRAVRKGQAAARTIGSRVKEIRYEELHHDPAGSLTELFEFCNIPAGDELVKKICTENNISRYKWAGEAQFRRGGRVGDWRTRFKAWDRLAFDLGAGALLRELRYETSKTWWLHGPSS
jgi:hypothetical protein